MLTEDRVNVGILHSFANAVFFCTLGELYAFKDCCESNIFGTLLKFKRYVPWIKLFKLLGRILLVLAIPTPFYIRLFIYYTWEHPEVMLRKESAAKLDLSTWFEYRVLHYFTPSHPALTLAYITYFFTGKIKTALKCI